jgi:TATA-box binding protein (TBP) (component of TFIID and TFIIIB)
MEIPRLTTMVVLYSTGVQLNTDRIVKFLPLTEECIKIEKCGVLKRGTSKRDSIKKRNAKTQPTSTGFGYNSVTIVLLNNGDGTFLKKEITIKIFQNGVFHITGVLDEAYDKSAIKWLIHHIEEHCPEAVSSDEWDLNSRRVVLMNYKTKLIGRESISRDRLYSKLIRDGIQVNYEPDVYPAVKIYFKDTKWIAKVFRTGNIILTGMTTKDDCKKLTELLTPLINE